MKTILTKVILVFGLAAMSGCHSDNMMVITPNPTTGKYETKFMTNWEVFQMEQEAGFQRELSGQPPDGGFKTWEAYWHWSYALIQKSFPNSEKEINWIKQRRQELGLPLYE